nr:DUF4402 domain-containing protein [Sphingomonas sp. LHG3406-1]
MRFAALLAFPLLFAGAAAHAQQVAPRSAVPRAVANAALVFPLTVVTKANMDFGYVAVTNAGTAVIDPDTGALSVTGGVMRLGGQPRPASFIGAARNAAVVIIRLPRNPITIRRVGGTETMTVRDFTLQGQSKRTLARMEASNSTSARP